jgi:hypothetical protein
MWFTAGSKKTMFVISDCTIGVDSWLMNSLLHPGDWLSCSAVGVVSGVDPGAVWPGTSFVVGASAAPDPAPDPTSPGMCAGDTWACLDEEAHRTGDHIDSASEANARNGTDLVGAATFSISA